VVEKMVGKISPDQLSEIRFGSLFFLMGGYIPFHRIPYLARRNLAVSDQKFSKIGTKVFQNGGYFRLNFRAKMVGILV